ncbi:MAG TPA: hypothetical protein VIN57_02025 [Magnetovibrio sp.]
MTHKTINQSITELRQSSQHLQQQTQFAHRQAATGAKRAKNVGAELAELDLEKTFRQLRQMVSMIGGKSRSDGTDTISFANQRRAMAAE